MKAIALIVIVVLGAPCLARDPVADAERDTGNSPLSVAIAEFQARARANGNPHFAALLSTETVKNSILRGIERIEKSKRTNGEPLSVKKARFAKRYKPKFLLIANEEAWPDGCSFCGFNRRRFDPNKPIMRFEPKPPLEGFYITLTVDYPMPLSEVSSAFGNRRGAYAMSVLSVYFGEPPIDDHAPTAKKLNTRTQRE